MFPGFETLVGLRNTAGVVLHASYAVIATPHTSDLLCVLAGDKVSVRGRPPAA